MTRQRAKKSGVLITFEGGEGVGKTTQIARLKALLRQKKKKVITTREPGGTKISQAIRELLLDRKHRGMDPTCELLLYEAARAELVRKVIRPALDEGYYVLCDRFTDSSLVYQGIGRKLGKPMVEQLNRIATGGLVPKVTFIFDLDPRIGLARLGSRGVLDRMEQERLEFHRAVRRGFLRQTQQNPRRYKRIDASRSRDEIADAIYDALERKKLL